MAIPNHTTTISKKGQVILPKLVREQLRWTPGTRLSVEHTTDGVLLRPMTTLFPPTRPEDVFACLANANGRKSIDDMNAGIATEIKRRHAHGRY